MRAQERGSPEGSFSLSAAWKKEIATSAFPARRLGREGPAHTVGCMPGPGGNLVTPLRTPPPPRQLSPLLQAGVLKGCILGHQAAPGAACVLPWRWAPGLVARRQSPKALPIQERETLEPQALQVSRLTTLLPKKPRCVPWGFSQTKEGRRSQGRPNIGKRLWKADLGSWAGKPLRAPRSRGEAFPGTSLPGHCSVLHKDWANGLWRVGPVAQWEEGKRA